MESHRSRDILDHDVWSLLKPYLPGNEVVWLKITGNLLTLCFNYR
jgi:hypothetical protein